MEIAGEDTKKGDLKDNGQGKIKNSLKSWLSNKYNLYFLAVLGFAFAVRLYYFFMTSGQPVWWDEGEYLSFANNLAFDIPYDINPQRVVLFPFLISLLFRIGFNETAAKFALVLLPSVLVVVVTYLFVKDLYDAKTALVASFLTSVLWVHLFYSMRMMNDEIGFLFGLLGWFMFWKGYVSGKNNKLVYLSGFLFALTFLMRPAGIFYPATLFVFLLLTDKFKMFAKKELWIMALVFLLTLAPHLIWSHYYHGNALAFQGAYGGTGGNPLGWQVFGFIQIYTELIFFIFFLVGLITLLPMILSFDKLLINNYKKYYSDLFIVLSFLFVLAVAIFVLRKFEDRWLVAFSLAIFVISAKGIILVTDWLKKHSGKVFALIVLALILISGSYLHLSHADVLIKDRLTSYLPVRDSGLWIRENSNTNDVIFSMSSPQTPYYSQRKTITYPYLEGNESDFVDLLLREKPRYYLVSAFERHDQFMYELPQKYQGAFNPVQVYQSSSGEPLLAVYEVNYANFSP